MATTLSSTSSSSGTISSAGVGSGLDVASIVSKLMEVESQPLVNLQTRQAAYESKLSALGTLKSLYSTLQTTVQSLSLGGSAFSAKTATASNTNVLTATADSTANAGTYTIGVKQLANNQVIEIGASINGSGDLVGYGATDTFKGGTLSVTVGSTTTNVTIADGSSLSSVAKAINNAKAGVTATVVNTGSANVLMLSSNTTGTSGSITLSASTTGTTGTQSLANFNYSSASPAALSLEVGTGYNTSEQFQSGSLSVTVGSTTSSVSIADGATLSDIADAITAAGLGVTASVTTDGSLSYLTITANSSSTQTISISGTSAGGVSGTLDLAELVGSKSASASKQLQAGQDALFTINGIEVTRSSNTVSDALAGVTLNLAEAGTLASPLTTKLTIAGDTSKAESSIQAFVSAYNAAVTQTKTLSAYDASNDQASVLTGDFAIIQLENKLPNLVYTKVSGLSGSIGQLSDIGITMQKDGTLSVDTSKLEAALNDPSKDVAKLFTSSATGNEGIAVKFNNALYDILGTDGVFDAETAGLTTTISDIKQQESNWETRLASIQANYLSQFNALDTLIASMNTTSTYLTQQLAMLTKKSS